MLRHLGEREAAQRIEQAMFKVFREGKVRTRDIGGTAKTSEFARAVIEAFEDAPAGEPPPPPPQG
jgi:isocitrate dehydrogenase (NAD+)